MADITYVPTAAGFLYLAVVVDVCGRQIVALAELNGKLLERDNRRFGAGGGGRADLLARRSSSLTRGR